MGTGKSSVGKALAARLGWPFVDVDDALEARFGPIPEQFAKDGEAVFRAREAAMLRALADGEPRVVATGGGAWVDPANRAVLREHHALVVLQAPLEVLAARVGQDPHRPLWDEGVAARYRSRASAYADADLHVDTGAQPLDAAVEEIVSWWQQQS